MSKFFQLVSATITLWVLSVSLGFAASDPSSRQFMTVSDIHFDPFTICDPSAACPLIDALRNAPSSQWNSILSREMKLLPHYGEDTNYLLLKSTMAELGKRARVVRPQFVLVLGDLIAHNYILKFKQYSSDKSQEAYEGFVRKTYEYLVMELNRAFPGVDVFAVVGNHETYQGSYMVDRNGAYYHDMNYVFARLIKNKRSKAELQNSFPVGGYYAINLPQQRNLKIIAVNSLIFSYRAQGAEVAKAADEELAWLHHELELAALRHQKVMIVDHIPDGVDVYSSLKTGKFDLVTLYKPEYTTRFEAEMQQFAPIIVGVLAGHFHTDWFQVLTYGNDKVPVSGVPSISPLVGNNPGYKVYQYSSLTLQLENFQTYYYPLNNASWIMMYDFNDEYQPGCYDCTLLAGMQNIAKDGYIAEQYIRNFHLRSQSLIQPYWLPYFWCDIFTVQSSDYQNCITSM